MPIQQPPLRRAIYLAAAWFILGVALVAIVIPGIPTTPLLLLSSYLFSRSSPALHRWLLRSQLFGPLLKDWEENGGVRRSVKVSAVIIVLTLVGLTVGLAKLSTLALCGLVAGVSIGLYVIYRIPVVSPSTHRLLALTPIAREASSYSQAAMATSRSSEAA